MHWENNTGELIGKYKRQARAVDQALRCCAERSGAIRAVHGDTKSVYYFVNGFGMEACIRGASEVIDDAMIPWAVMRIASSMGVCVERYWNNGIVVWRGWREMHSLTSNGMPTSYWPSQKVIDCALQTPRYGTEVAAALHLLLYMTVFSETIPGVVKDLMKEFASQK